MKEYLLSARGQKLLIGYGLLMLVFINLPVLILAPISFGEGRSIIFPPPKLSLEWYEGLVYDARWRRAIFLSFEVASLATLMSVILGVSASIGIHNAPERYARPLKFLFLSPLVVPLMVVSVGFYITYVRLGLLGKTVPLALAHAVVILPYVILPILARLSSTDPALERASASLGAGTMRTLWLVTLPPLVPAIVATAAFAFVFSFDEVVLAQFLAGPRLETLPRKVWSAITLDGADKTITAIATIQLFIVGAVSIATWIFTRRRSVQ